MIDTQIDIVCTASNSRTVINIGNCSYAILGGKSIKLHALFLVNLSVEFTDNARFIKVPSEEKHEQLISHPEFGRNDR